EVDGKVYEAYVREKEEAKHEYEQAVASGQTAAHKIRWQKLFGRVSDGYFVHFFAPTELKPLRKHAIFVLDVSGSMGGRKIEQLKEAMEAILDDLNEGDYFNIVEFSYSVTNITTDGKPEPIIVFLTDGEPTVGELRPGKIQATVREFNTNPQASIFSLSLGYDADYNFLKKLSLRNSGFARKIYEASDTALQLRDFYRQVASPLLANVTFNYQPDQVDEQLTTRRTFPTLFSGAELVVAGKLRKQALQDEIIGHVSGSSISGDSFFSSPDTRKASSLERLWAYLTIQQLLEQHDVQTEDGNNSTENEYKKKALQLALKRLWAYLTIQQLLEQHDVQTEDGNNSTENEYKKKALQLALKYSFVTPVTSLVVVKPNDTHAVGSEVVQPAADRFGASTPLIVGGGPPGLQAYPGLPGAPGPMPPAQGFHPTTTHRPIYMTSTIHTTSTTSRPTTETSVTSAETTTETEGVSCTIGEAKEAGVCVPLPQCVLQVFSKDIQMYLKEYFCAIDKFYEDGHLRQSKHWNEDYSGEDISEEDASEEDESDEIVEEIGKDLHIPKIQNLHVHSTIRHRYARTVVCSRIANLDQFPKEVEFSFAVPESALVSAFQIETDGKVYKAKIGEKKLPKETSQHHYTAHRDTKRVSLPMTLKAESNALFNLTYEELLVRRSGQYRHVVTLDPGQVVTELKVDVRIIEPKGLAMLDVVLISVNGNYFVQFFAIEQLSPLPKHFIFVLDVSGSMVGEKMHQVKKAMDIIIGDLRREDYFINLSDIRNMNLRSPVNPDLIPESFIFFLTDGAPTEGEKNTSKIIEQITKNNDKGKGAIFTIALGEKADLHFLKKLSCRNSGYTRKIYESSDIALQLTEFYREYQFLTPENSFSIKLPDGEITNLEVLTVVTEQHNSQEDFKIVGNELTHRKKENKEHGDIDDDDDDSESEESGVNSNTIPFYTIIITAIILFIM
ncbi:hypothetical protein C0J52_09411, partial [Blattella germanica]